jgi:hypothetical protein
MLSTDGPGREAALVAAVLHGECAISEKFCMYPQICSAVPQNAPQEKMKVNGNHVRTARMPSLCL